MEKIWFFATLGLLALLEGLSLLGTLYMLGVLLYRVVTAGAEPLRAPAEFLVLFLGAAFVFFPFLHWRLQRLEDYRGR